MRYIEPFGFGVTERCRSAQDRPVEMRCIELVEMRCIEPAERSKSLWPVHPKRIGGSLLVAVLFF